MGHVDLESLFKIYYEVNSIKKRCNLNYDFKIDVGNYETAIEFIEKKPYHPPLSKDWSNPVIFCPDLLDWHNKIIIEYEEEIGDRRPGAKLAIKGHNREGDIDNKRDSNRTTYYLSGGFHTLRIWESDVLWKEKLEKFLLGIHEHQQLLNVKS